MKVNLKEIKLYDQAFAYASFRDDSENATIFMEMIRKYIDEVNMLLMANFNELSDLELYQLLKIFYHIEVRKEDSLKILSIKNNGNYDKISKLFTDISFIDNNQKYQVYFNVAVSANMKITKRIYTKEEINELIANKDIVILSGRSIDMASFKKRNFTLEYDDTFDDFSNTIVIENMGIFGNLLRERFPQEVVYKDMRKYVANLKKDIDKVCETNQEGISKLCMEWLQNSEEEKVYQKIRENLGMN